MAPGPTFLTVFFAKADQLNGVNAILFSGHQSSDHFSHLSNSYMESFKDGNGITYSCGESYLQAGKAYQIQDKHKFAQIAHAKYVYEAKNLRNGIKELDVAKQNQMSSKVIQNDLFFKYHNSPDLREDLLSTGNKCLVQTLDNPDWGTGLKTLALAISTPIYQWLGEKKLGEVFMRAQGFFKALQDQENESDRFMVSAL